MMIGDMLMHEGIVKSGLMDDGTYNFDHLYTNIAKDISSARLKAMKRSGQVECETCANREYKDGSDEVNVSFKSSSTLLTRQQRPQRLWHMNRSMFLMRTGRLPVKMAKY